MQSEEYCDFLDEYKREHTPVFLTPSEAMDILNVGKNTMYRLLNTGQLQGVRIGRIWRISLEAIQNFSL